MRPVHPSSRPHLPFRYPHPLLPFFGMCLALHRCTRPLPRPRAVSGVEQPRPPNALLAAPHLLALISFAPPLRPCRVAGRCTTSPLKPTPECPSAPQPVFGILSSKNLHVLCLGATVCRPLPHSFSAILCPCPFLPVPPANAFSAPISTSFANRMQRLRTRRRLRPEAVLS